MPTHDNKRRRTAYAMQTSPQATAATAVVPTAATAVVPTPPTTPPTTPTAAVEGGAVTPPPHRMNLRSAKRHAVGSPDSDEGKTPDKKSVAETENISSPVNSKKQKTAAGSGGAESEAADAGNTGGLVLYDTKSDSVRCTDFM